MLRLTRGAGSDSGQRPATRFRYFVTAFHATGLCFACRHVAIVMVLGRVE